jgi:AcrR family transcriptional regulator
LLNSNANSILIALIPMNRKVNSHRVENRDHRLEVNAGTSDTPDSESDVRTRILNAANALIATGGTEAATTRGVGAAAGVQAPTIYRLFGDKRGLLEAVAEYGLSNFVADKSTTVPSDDPVQDLRNGWDTNIAFGVTNPELFTIMSSNPHLRTRSRALSAGTDILTNIVHRIARTGRLQISEERAVALIQSVSVGTVLTLLSQPSATRDAGLSNAAREAVITAITTQPANQHLANHQAASPAVAASSLRAQLAQTTTLTPGEKHLLNELLTRIANEEPNRGA